MNHKKLEEKIDKLENIVLENLCRQKGGSFEYYGTKKQCRKDYTTYEWNGRYFVHDSSQSL